jgi:hypothetical protein
MFSESTHNSILFPIAIFNDTNIWFATGILPFERLARPTKGAGGWSRSCKKIASIGTSIPGFTVELAASVFSTFNIKKGGSAGGEGNQEPRFHLLFLSFPLLVCYPYGTHMAIAGLAVMFRDYKVTPAPSSS